VLFTNYQFYIDEFIKLGHEQMQDPASDYLAFVEPGNVVTRRAGEPPQPGDELGLAPPRLPQMPAYHLVRGDHAGITMVNIGVGPANAKTITDHIAVLRPHAWLMLGHCAGLRNSQQLGDYVLAHGYVREDHVLDEDLPLWVPIPALAEVQVALEQAVADVTQLSGYELKRILRTGTVASTDNRNWELLPSRGASSPERRFSQSRAVALDMESATIAANGFRFRVPYGTLLCVSDKPLHGEIKLPGMANHFYRERVDQHLRIGMRAIELLRQERPGRLHSRKLRSFAEVAFQ
jgi:AMP nucleosidase